MALKPNSWRNIVEDYFTFAKFQRRAIIVLLSGIVLLFIVPSLWHFFVGTSSEKVNKVLIEEVAQLKVKENEYGEGNQQTRTSYSDYNKAENGFNESKNAGSLFPFDPNTITTEEWMRLGIREKTAITIQKYVAKGGRFYKPEDLGKIYGLRKNEVDRLIPYVRIAGIAAQDFKKNAVVVEDKKLEGNRTVYSLKTIDINTADTSAFIALPGIGSKLAARIVNYRDKLGGFHSVSQIGETYGLQDSIFQRIRPRLTVGGRVTKININTATAAELKMPYLSYNVINAVIQYRTQHGSFKSVDDLKKIMLIDGALFDKIYPYLVVE
jgi:competence protein ComEA